MKKRLAGLAALCGALCACGGGGGTGANFGGASPPPNPYSLPSGVAQKGPFVVGSSVSVEEVEANLFSPTGREFDFETTSDIGTFTASGAFPTQYAYVEGEGYYFDEVTSQVSDGQITLSALSDLSTATVLNVNVLTSLAYPRIQKLVSGIGSNLTFANAQAQAQSEVLAAFGIHHASSYGDFGTLDISKGSDGDKILVALSSLLVNGNNSDNLNLLIAHIQTDIQANGAITIPATQAALLASAKTLNPAGVAANLNQKYGSFGVLLAASDISDWIDQDGDGVVGKFKYQVLNAIPASVFTFPALVTDPYAGTPVSISSGVLSVNGTQVIGAVAINAGDVVSVSPSAAGLPDGMLTTYLLSGTLKIARVVFLGG